MRRFTKGAVCFSVAMHLTACGGASQDQGEQGGGGTDDLLKPLDVDSAFVTTPSEQLSVAGSLALIPARVDGSASLLLTEAESDMAKHRVNYRVREQATDAIDQAGGILCFMRQTQYWNFVNQGSYVAMVDEDACFGTGGNGQPSSLMRVIVESSREENRPIVTDFRVIGAGGDEGVDINGRLTVAEAPSSGNPLGVFRMRWDMGEQGGGMIDARRNENRQLILSFVDIWSRDEGGQVYSGETRANAVLSFDIVDGEVQPVGGWLNSFNRYPHFNGSEMETKDMNFKVSFSDDFLRVMEESASIDQCKDYNNYLNMAHGYNLYDAEGALVSLGENGSGVQIEFEVDGKTRHGHASYWGVWTDGGDVQNGQEVSLVRWQDGQRNTEAATIVTAPGKLMKYSRTTVNLSSLVGVELDFHDHQNQSQYRVKYDGSNFVKTQKISFNEDGENIEAASGNVEPSEWGYFEFHVPSLQARINIPASEKANGDYEIVYHSGEVVSGNEDEFPTEELHCFSRCPKIQVSADELNSWDAAYIKQSMSAPWDSSQTIESMDAASLATADVMKSYQWNAAARNISDGTTLFAITDSSSNQGGGHLSTGALVTASALAVLGSESERAQLTPWDLENKAEVFYRWESGTSPWSKYVGLKDSQGKDVRFAKPLELAYTHSTANDMNQSDAHDGMPARLNYGGPGQLWGIPSRRSPEFGYHIPLYTLKDGVTIGDYKARPLEVEQLLGLADSAESCASLDYSQLPELPAAELPDFTPADLEDEESTPVRVIKGDRI